MSERFTRMKERGLTSLVAAGLIAALLVAAGPATARPRPLSLPQAETADESLAPAQRDQLFPTQRGGGVSLAQATRMAQSRFPGRVVRAEQVQMGDRVVYEIRILDAEGVVRNVRIDAQTGRFL
ncbi:MAG TPA: PepSY domain-containing protein [Gammaproteobacteria bacterium]|nr:PepSY domain-containing protein [Gammaproteobacteria bacterium]